MQKFIKNISISDTNVGGTLHPAGAFFEIKDERLQRYAYRQEVLDAINNDLILLSKDGTTTLSKADSLKFVREIEFAENISFDNNNTNLQATNTQDAIEEVTESPIGALETYSFVELGTASNKWLDYGSNSINSNGTFTIIPFSAKLIACTFSNINSGVDTDIEIHKADAGDGDNTDKIATFQVRDKRVAKFSNFSAITFNSGDKFAVYLKDQGTNPRNVVVRLYFLITDFDKENSGEDFSSDLSLGIGGITITIGS